MAFAQNMQAYLIDRYYHYLNERFPEQAEDALLTAFHRYMFQQGNRAAQRAVRDKKPLDFENYERYREVVSTEEMKREDSPHGGERHLSPELFEVKIYQCTAHRLFGQLGTPKAAERIFCRHVDKMNVWGFNPDIPYEVRQILCDAEYCLQVCKNPGCAADAPINTRMPDAPPFPYIMANQFASMGQIIEAIFGDAGREINDAVRRDFIERYGESDWSQIEPYLDSDFDIYYPLGLKKK